jgi:methylase of polypeptide subunit release factors
LLPIAAKGLNVSNRTNEWEFQGAVITWINAFLRSHPVGLETATQEVPNSDGHRSDVTVWRNRAAKVALLTAELKTPQTRLTERNFQRDAVRKAQLLTSPYLALWNMQALSLYRTPPQPRQDLLPEDFLYSWDPDPQVTKASDWLKSGVKLRLEERARDLIIRASDVANTGAVARTVVDATVFVSVLTERIRLLRLQLEADVRDALTNKALRTEIVRWADRQGLRQLVGDWYAALAGQIAYRVVGQTLFYLAFKRRHELPALRLESGSPLQLQLRTRWDAIRAYDYEALYEPSPLEKIPLSPDTQERLISLVSDLAGYDWSNVHSDVLGRVFEHLIPGDERIALGQYYTADALADVILGLALATPNDRILDPAVGTGTFLRRAHQRLRQTAKLRHEDILDRLWGVDISAFAAELAVINLCRQDLDSVGNFPRVAVRDFFDLRTTDSLEFPPAQILLGSQLRERVPIPSFDVVVGNPPYVRSQQLDDLDATYKAKLARVAVAAGLSAAPKFDAFAYFMLHSRQFLKPGGRLAFVTSAAWLTSNYGGLLQKFILAQFEPKLLLFSMAEPFFPVVAVDTVVVILEARAAESTKPRGTFRFVTLQSPLSELLPAPDEPDYWSAVDRFITELETAACGAHAGFSVAQLNADEELKGLGDGPRNWARPFRLTPIYQELFP